MAAFRNYGLRPSRVSHKFSVASLAIMVTALIAPAPFLSAASPPVDFVGFEKSQMSAAAAEGMDEIFSGRMFQGAMPAAAMKAMASAASGSADELGYDPNTPEGEYYRGSSLPSPPFRSQDVSLGRSLFERDGVVLANGNCFSCHAGMVHGKVVAGLGNNRVMPRPKPKATKKPSMIAMMKLMGSMKTDEEKQVFAERMKSLKSMKINTPDNASRGDHFGPFAVWNVSARLADPANSGLLVGDERTELVELFESTIVPPVDPMPWWLMKYKQRSYWYSDSSPHSAKDFSMNFTSVHELANEYHVDHVASTDKALAFARETQSPLFPHSLDADLVKLGADLFHGRAKPSNRKGFVTCKNCHGSYSKKDPGGDWSMPGGWAVDYKHSDKFRNVKTDPTYNAVLQKFQPIVDHLNQLAKYYEAQGTPELAPQASVPDRKGYVAPPLVGVWASAPYFHNGSVPTVTAVLNSNERPEIWSRNFSDPHAYDLDLVGLEHQPMMRSEYVASADRAANAHPNSKASIDHRSIYDTKGYGHANTGHTFGDSLTVQERSAVIEFLKSLSGPDM